jgi:predicted transposase YbfD/YdcC
VQYAITSVPRRQASAHQLLAWWRGHWGIENKLHWVRDVVLGEDSCRVRSGQLPKT